MTLSEIEAQRMIVVVEEAIERLDLLRALSKHGEAGQAGKRSIASTSRIACLLHEEKQLQQKHKELCEQSRIGKMGAGQDWDLTGTIENLRSYRASISRAMGAEDPEYQRKLGEIGRQRADLADQLRQLAFDLSQPDHSFTSLREKIGRNLNYDQQRKRALQQQSAAESQRLTLESELQQIEEKFVERRTDVDEAIAQLTDELKAGTEELAVRVKLDSDISRAEINTVVRMRQNQLEAIENEISLTDSNMEREISVSTKTREFLEQQIDTNRNRLASWEVKFEEELADKNDELATLTTAFMETREQLDVLETRWAKDEEDTARKAAEAQVAGLRAEIDAVAQRLENAAAIIQRAWRHKRHRRATNRASKKKKRVKPKSGKKKKK